LGGTVAKKLDNGLMALFGCSAIQENDAERAVGAALATPRALAELNRTNAPLALAARIVIDSVPMVIDTAGEMFGDLPNSVTQAQALAERPDRERSVTRFWAASASCLRRARALKSFKE
jgi:hypothetical protein